MVYSNDDWLETDPIYVKFKFGRICFCIEKKWKLLIFWKLVLSMNFNFVFAINLMSK